MAISQHAKLALHAWNKERRFRGCFLIWGGIMLQLMALWLANKHDDFPTAIILLLRMLGVAGKAWGIKACIPIFEKEQTVEQIDERKKEQTRPMSFALIASGLFCVVLTLWLSFGYGMPAFGEAVGLGLVGLIGIACGTYMLRGLESQISADRFIEFLRSKSDLLFFFFVALAVLCSAMFVWLLAIKKVGWAGFPEWGGFFFLAIVFLAAAVWLNIASKDSLSTSKCRYILLYAGVLCGAVIALMTMVRAYIWRDSVFLGGMSAWQRDGGWRFWICAYTLLIGLGILFGSLFLARSEIRKKPNIRLAFFGYNTFLGVMLMVGILVILNIVFYAAFPYTFNWTKTSNFYSLSGSSKDVLAKLNEKTTIYVTVPHGTTLHQDLKVLLDNCQVETDRLEVIEVSPDRDVAKYTSLLAKYPELGRGILLVHGAESISAKAATSRTFISKDKLEEFNPHTKEKTRKFHGEKIIMEELRFLVDQKKKRKIYFLQGHGELDISATTNAPRRNPLATMEQYGGSELANRLKRSNYETAALSFEDIVGEKKKDVVYAPIDPKTKKKMIPKDAWGLIVAGATQDMEQETLDAIENFMTTAGGRMVVFADVVVADQQFKSQRISNFEKFLEKFNVAIDNKVVFGFPGIDFIPYILYATVPEETKNDLAKKFKNLRFPLDTIRPVGPSKTKTAFTAEVFLQIELGRNSEGHHVVIWNESDLKTFFYPFGKIRELLSNGTIAKSKEPIPVAVTVTSKGKPRMVVFGDTDFAANHKMSSGEREYYYALQRSALDWLAERPGLGIPPKEAGTFELKNVNKTRMVLYPGWLMIISIAGLGTGIWIVRRR